MTNSRRNCKETPAIELNRHAYQVKLLKWSNCVSHESWTRWKSRDNRSLICINFSVLSTSQQMDFEAWTTTSRKQLQQRVVNSSFFSSFRAKLIRKVKQHYCAPSGIGREPRKIKRKRAQRVFAWCADEVLNKNFLPKKWKKRKSDLQFEMRLERVGSREWKIHDSRWNLGRDKHTAITTQSETVESMSFFWYHTRSFTNEQQWKHLWYQSNNKIIELLFICFDIKWCHLLAPWTSLVNTTQKLFSYQNLSW